MVQRGISCDTPSPPSVRKAGPDLATESQEGCHPVITCFCLMGREAGIQGKAEWILLNLSLDDEVIAGHVAVKHKGERGWVSFGQKGRKWIPIWHKN